MLSSASRNGHLQPLADVCGTLLDLPRVLVDDRAAMAFNHTELPETELGPAVVKAVGAAAPPPMRMMVARGLAPLGPRDLLVALYHLWVGDNEKLRDEAGKTVTTLPPNLLQGALQDAALPAGVLDFVARRLHDNEAVLTGVVAHKNVHDETLVGVARSCPDNVCDVLADNQTRWVACPAIVEALYQNKNCRMSVAHRMVEFAVREGIELKLANIEEIRQALGNAAAPDPKRDALFRAAEEAVDVELDVDAAPFAQTEDDPLGDLLDDDFELPLEEDVKEVVPQTAEKEEVNENSQAAIQALSPMEKIRLAMLGGAFARGILVKDNNKSVAMAAIKSPKVKESEVTGMCMNRSLHPEVIRYITTRRDWVKLYTVKLNLVLNPKTPLQSAMTYLGHLHASDVKKVSRSHNIPAGVKQAARRKLSQRQ